MIAVDHRLTEIVLQVVDRFDHSRVGAAEEIAVGFGAGIFLDDLFPFFRRDFRVSVAFQAETELMYDRIAGLAQIFYLVLIGCFDVGADQYEFLDADLIEGLGNRLRRRDGRTAARFLDDINDRGLVRQAVFH